MKERNVVVHSHGLYICTYGLYVFIVYIGKTVPDTDPNKDFFYFAHERQSALKQYFAQDFVRWKRMDTFVRRVNNTLSFGKAQSFYSFSMFNPLNLISLRTLSKAFGMHVLRLARAYQG